MGKRSVGVDVFLQAEDGMRDLAVTGVQSCVFSFQAEDGIRDLTVTGVQTCALPILVLAINPATPTTLYAGTADGGVFESTNGAASWTAINSGLIDTYVLALAIDPATPSTLDRKGGVLGKRVDLCGCGMSKKKKGRSG